MNATRQTLLLVVMAFGLALAFSFFNTAFSQSDATRGPYMIAAGYDRTMVWRVDQATGRVSYCRIDNQSLDPKFIAGRPPFCSAWSNN